MSTPPTLTRSGYAVGSPSRTCAATGRVLQTGEAYVAALVQSPGTEDYRRVDMSLEAWKSGARPRAEDGSRLPVLGSWRGVMPEPGARKRILIDDESLLDLFEQSGEQASDVDASPSPCTDSAEPASADDRGAFRFLLALILIRKRLLVCERTGKDGTMFVRPRSSPKSSEGGTLSQVRDPGLSEGSITRVVGQLSALLEGDLAAPPSTPPPPPATSSAPSSGATA